MAVDRRHLIAPLAIGVAALSLAGTGAAFAATGTHTATPTAFSARRTTAVTVKADRPDRDATTDVAGKDTSTEAATDVASTGTTHDAAQHGPRGGQRPMNGVAGAGGAISPGSAPPAHGRTTAEACASSWRRSWHRPAPARRPVPRRARACRVLDGPALVVR